jgi:uncharacterized RDD family membrane protein YckC
MSLKSFHIVFVTVTLVLFAFLILWGFLLAPERSALATLMGYTGVAGSLIMTAYGVYFVRKLRRIHL